MKWLCVITVCLLAIVGFADRRGQLINQRAATSSSTNLFNLPTTLMPGIWLDVIEQVTNSLADFTLVTNHNNYGYLGGYFTNGVDSGNPPTNKFYRSIEGGCITGIGPTTSGAIWHTNGHDANNQSYFTTNLATTAYRVNYSGLLFADQARVAQSGTSPPCNPSGAFMDLHINAGQWLMDWGTPSPSNRLSFNNPVGSTNAWLNVAFVKSNDTMQLWLAGTNFVNSLTNTCFVFPTNNAAGPLDLMQLQLNTNYLVKRILMWNYALTPLEITNLHTWMNAMP